MITIYPQKSPKFSCDICCYNTSNKKDYSKHLSTTKHLKLLMNDKNDNQKSPKIPKNEEYICNICNNNYKYLSGLSRHRKICKNNNTINNQMNEFMSNENLFEIIKQNQDFKDLLIEQNKIIIDLSTKINITNNTNCNNKTFNLQVFLNEKCKDALNISDFVNSLKLTLEDLENVGDKGFVNGITRIFVNGLKKLDIYKRPIHCSDLKRETMYLKNENVWEKDNDNKENMKKVIKQIANKNINKIYEWKDKYPDCKYSDSKKNDQYSRIIIESMGARTIEEDQVLYEKIIKNIAKETTIDKTK